MGFFSTLFSGNATPERRGNSFFAPGEEVRSLPGGEQRSWDAGGISTTDPRILELFGLNAGGVNVNAESALRLAHVFRCVDLISSTAADLPWSIRRKTSTGSEAADNHPNATLYACPDKESDTLDFIWRKTLFMHALLWGNGYAKIKRNGVYRPVSLAIYHPTEVTVKKDGRRLWYKFADERDPLPSSEVIHLKLFTTDGLMGRTPIQIGAESLKVSLQGQRFAQKFLENGAMVSGVLTVEKALSGDARKNLRDSFSPYVGPNNAGGVPLLEDGIKYEKMGISPGDFKLLEMTKASAETICTWFGVPQHLAGVLDRATFSNIEHQDLEYMKYSMSPHIKNFRQEFDYKTLQTIELGRVYTHVNFNGLLRADTKTRAEYYRTFIQNGLMCQDEARALEDLNPIEGGAGQRYWIQQNMMPLDKAEEILASKGRAPALADEPKLEPAEA